MFQSSINWPLGPVAIPPGIPLGILHTALGNPFVNGPGEPFAVPVLATAAGNGGEPVVLVGWYPGNLTFAVGVRGVSSSAYA